MSLRQLSLEELLELPVVTPARQLEPLYRSSSAISVLRGEDIRRAGVTSIPDALRLVPGMQVAQQNGRTWAISTRGFNLVAANKLEVVFDGRSTYTPFFSGTFWDVQDTFLPDVQQIEVVRGPGGTLWGANAVNGVINIQTKSALDTRGSVMVAGVGSRENAFVGVRHGAQLGESKYGRAYARYFHRDWLRRSDGAQGQADREFLQGGFRYDSYPNPETQFTAQGDVYSDELGLMHRPPTSTGVTGGNALVRLRRERTTGETVEAQAYWDHTERVIPGIFDETRNTTEVSLLLGRRYAAHNLLLGMQARGSWDVSRNVGSQVLLPAEETLWLLGALVQDQVILVPDRFVAVLGAKLERHTYTDFELQPSVRLAWHPSTRTTVWTAAARAVRTPVRIDRDLVIPATGTPTFRGTDQYGPESVVGFQVGARRQMIPQLSIDASAYWNLYSDLRSNEYEAGAGTPLTFKNGFKATTSGVEVSARVSIGNRVLTSVGYSYQHLDIGVETGAQPVNDPSALGNDAQHLGFFHMAADVGRSVEADVMFRGASSLPAPEVPGYVTADLRLAWSVTPELEWSIVGRDLTRDQHPEFGAPNPRREEMPRSIYTSLLWRF